jgi:hypothetical protein
MTPNRPSDMIRRSVIVPIQLGGSFLISLTSPLVSLASRVISRKSHEVPTQTGPVSPEQPMEINQNKKPDHPEQKR